MMLLCFFALLMLGVASAAHLMKLNADATVIPNEYIVVFKKDVEASAMGGAMPEGMTLAKQFVIGSGFKAAHVVAAEGQVGALEALLSHPSVDYVEPNQEMHAFETEQSCSDQTDDVPWGISRITHEDANHNDEFRHDGGWGSDVNVYIIDTGVYIEHNDYDSRAVWGTNTIDNSDSDGNGHGTHVASTAGGAVYGISRGSKIIGVKVLSASGGGSTASVIGGINWVTEQHKSGDKSVANMSLGGGRSSALNDAVDASTGAGVIHVVAAGNSNNDACTHSPASAETAITVVSTALAGVGANRGDERSSFSSYGNCTQIAAPGSDIKAAWIGNPTATRTISGTSMASPHVCGVVARILSDNAPGMTRDQVLAELKKVGQNDMIKMNCANSACEATPNILVHANC